MTTVSGGDTDGPAVTASPTRPSSAPRGALRRVVAFFDPAEEGFLRRMAALGAVVFLVAACAAATAVVAFARTSTGRYWTTVAFLESGQLARAERAARALTADPKTRTYGSYRLLTTALRREGKVDEQLAAFDDAVQAFPDLDLAQGHRCWYYALYGRAADGIWSCDRAVELASAKNAGKVHFYRAAARYLVGDSAGAIQDLQAAQSAWQAGATITAGYESTARRWLAALQSGQTILDASEIEQLRRWF